MERRLNAAPFYYIMLADDRRTLQAALDANVALQRVLRAQLKRVQDADRALEKQFAMARAEERKIAQRRAASSASSSAAAGRPPLPHPRLWPAFRLPEFKRKRDTMVRFDNRPYFRGSERVPAFAPDAARHKRIRAHTEMEPRPWTAREDEALRRGVKRAVGRVLLDEALAEGVVTHSSSSSSSSSSGGVGGGEDATPRLVPRGASLREWVAAIEALDAEAVVATAATRLSEGVEWRHIALSALVGRGAEECRHRWRNVVALLSAPTAQWSALEQERLARVAAERGGRGWEAIARAVGGGHTPWECFSAHARAALKKRPKRKWSAEEDDILRRAVLLFADVRSAAERRADGVHVAWDEVAVWLNAERAARGAPDAVAMRRNGQQCFTRWSKVRSSFLLFAYFFCLLIYFFCLLIFISFSARRSRQARRSAARGQRSTTRVSCSVCTPRTRAPRRAPRRARAAAGAAARRRAGPSSPATCPAARTVCAASAGRVRTILASATARLRGPVKRTSACWRSSRTKGRRAGRRLRTRCTQRTRRLWRRDTPEGATHIVETATQLLPRCALRERLRPSGARSKWGGGRRRRKQKRRRTRKRKRKRSEPREQARKQTRACRRRRR